MNEPFLNETGWVIMEEMPRFQDEPIESVLHVMPTDDYEDHAISFRCWCSPYLDHKERDTGTELVIHRKVMDDKH